MKKIKLYIATSLDGFIARPDGALDWFPDLLKGSKDRHGFRELMNSIDIIVMSSKTYHEIIGLNVDWPYKTKTTYVISHQNTNLNENDNVIFITEKIVENIIELKKGNGNDIWLVGGGQLITLFLNHDLIDEMQISYIPVILGEGIPLFPNEPKESKWEIIKNKIYDSGILKADYQKLIDN